jgi:DNA-binding IclR family transcriptional regulator
MPGAANGHQYNVSNLLRGLDILELLLQHPEGLGISEIARRRSIPKNAAFRIVSALHEREYLVRSDERKAFRLSPRLVTMGYQSGNLPGLLEAAMPPMRKLRDEVEETVVLSQMVGDRILAIDSVPGLHAFRLCVDPGMVASLHASAPGKAVLAFLPDGMQAEVLGRLTLRRFNPRTITDRGAMRRELAGIRQRGYAVDRSEEFNGVHCVSAPILNAGAFPVATVTATGPAHRFTAKHFPRCGALVRACARTISKNGFFSTVR